MKRILVSISVIFLFCCGSLSRLEAAQPDAFQDTLSVKSYDASDYSLMKRWRPADAVPFEKKGFFSNMFIGVSGSGYRTMYPGYSIGPRFSVHLGKWFNAYNAVRIAPGVGYYFENSNGARVKQIDVKASYLFNMMTYLGGYRPSRFIEISTVAGLGYTYNWGGSNAGHSMTAHLGLNFSAHATRNVHVFFEPLVELSVDGLGRQGSALKYRVMPYLLGTVGLSCRFGKDSRDYIPEGNWFLHLIGGTQFQTSDIVLNDMSISNAFGMHFAFGVGRTYWNWFAFRLSVAYSKHNWDRTLGGVLLESEYAVGRAEAIVDLVSLIGRTDRNRFCLSVMAGPEAGILHKDTIGRKMTPFVGITGAVQAKTRLSDRFAIFIEPRISMVPYPGPSGVRHAAYRNYYDGVFNCSAGVEFNL